MADGARAYSEEGWFHGRIGYRRFYRTEPRAWKHAHLFIRGNRYALCKQSWGSTWFRKIFIDRNREVQPKDKCPRCRALSKDLKDKVDYLLQD